MEQWIPDYFTTLGKEIEICGRADDGESRIHTIYFGGGTPTLIPEAYYGRLMELIGKYYSLDDNLEISMEANPGTIGTQRFSDYARLGINRVSLGAQSFHADELALLGRIHSSDDVFRAVNAIRESGIDNINIDLIYGLPGQTLSKWAENLRKALDLSPEHLSLYCLTIEDGTLLDAQVKTGKVIPLQEDDTADQFENSIEVLSQAGYLHYEISNWAKIEPEHMDHRCQHNLQYWKNEEYFGFGAGAHGYIRGRRTVNAEKIPQYIAKSQDDEATLWIYETDMRIDPHEKMKDEMMLGLRLVDEGIDRQSFLRKFGVDYSQLFSKEIDNLIRQGLLEWKNDSHLVLTKRGIPLANFVFRDFV